MKKAKKTVLIPKEVEGYNCFFAFKNKAGKPKNRLLFQTKSENHWV
jgi:hypothetical protein